VTVAAREGAEGDVGASVGACGDASEILEAAEGALDQGSLAVGASVERMVLFAGGIVRDHRHGAACQQEAADAGAAIGRIGDAEPG